MEDNEMPEGTNSDAQVDQVDIEEQQSPTPQNPKGVPKLLAQRNALRAENELLKAQMEEIVNQKLGERDRRNEKIQFSQKYGNELLDQVEWVIQKYPNLSYEDALKVANPEGYVNWSKDIKMQGNIPQRITADKPLKEMTDDELKQGMVEELAAMGIQA